MTSLPAYYQPTGTVTASAHRGFSLDGLENSMAAFQAAVDLGLRYLETDAHGTADGIAVALHDHTLDRTTDSHGTVGSLPWASVRRAKIGGVEPVPSLEEVLGTWPEVHVQVDVKSASGIEPIAHAIERTASHDRVCVASFSTRRRRATVARLSAPVAQSAGTAEVSRLVAGTWVRDSRAGARPHADSFQLPVSMAGIRIVTPAVIEAVHRAGKQIHVWTINDTAQMAQLLDMGVDGIITDRADRLRALLEERGQWL